MCDDAIIKSYLDASVGGVSDGLQQFVILWVKSYSEGTVDDSPLRRKHRSINTETICFLKSNRLQKTAYIKDENIKHHNFIFQHQH